MNIKKFGQVFTPKEIVLKMISLIKNKGNVLEPSCGNNAIYDLLPDPKIGIEIDNKLCKENISNIDFFTYSINNKFDTIIANPPYVSGKNISKETKSLLNSKLITHTKSNLYLYFIEKCLHHLNDNGEMIFITPVNFLKNTFAEKLNEYIYDKGTITHMYICENNIFDNCNVDTCIWRFENNNFSRNTQTNEGDKNFILHNKQLLFTNEIISKTNMKDLFLIKTGAVSALDEIFVNENGNTEFVCSFTNKTGMLKKAFYNIQNDYLLSHKEELLNRKIKKFDENNWFKWGRDFFYSERKRIYVNLKTRNNKPFFINECKNYDGTVLALIPLTDEIENNLNYYLDILNNTNWKELGFYINGRFLFNQKSLSNINI